MRISQNLFDRLRSAPENRGITFIDGAGSDASLSYAQLHDQSLRILRNLIDNGVRKGDELVIQVDDNRRFILLFWACMAGDIIPVPLSPGKQGALKLFAIWSILKKPFLVTDEGVLSSYGKTAMEEDCVSVFESIQKRAIAISILLRIDSSPARIDLVDADSIAYIQFSSGSTGSPKGIALTHRNLFTNINSILSRSGTTQNDSVLSWMPLTHDMGLIGVHLLGVLAGINQYLMPTALFVRRPLLWMEKTSFYRASQLYSPNFGLQYLVNALETSTERHDWDLSCVRVLYNGAESISPKTCTVFNARLAKYNFSDQVICPVYGLAEASVAVSIPDVGAAIKVHRVDRSTLSMGSTVRLTESDQDPNTVNFVEVGYAIPDCYIRICDDHDEPEPENTIGLIQIKGGNVMNGYYADPDATRKASTIDGWLRTGDLGFISKGKLVVTGRLKNLIVIHGQNFYPQDIEFTASMVGLDMVNIAACGVRNDSDGTEEVIIFVVFKKPVENFVALSGKIKDIIWERMNVAIAHVIPIPRFPKTTSGKVQYFKLSEQYRAGGFDAMLMSLKRIGGANSFDSEESNERIAKISRLCSGILQVQTINPDESLIQQGMASMYAMRLIFSLEEHFQVTLSVSELLMNPTVRALSQRVGAKQASRRPNQDWAAEEQDHYPLTPPQIKWWTMHQVDGGRSETILTQAVTLRGAFHPDRFRLALRYVVERHEILRMHVVLLDGVPRHKLHRDAESLPFFTHDKTGLRGQNELKEFVDELSGKDLDPLSLWAVDVIQSGREEFVVVWRIHHLIIDGWSVGLFMQELEQSYEAVAHGQHPPLEPLRHQFKDYATLRSKKTANGGLAESEKYWRQQFDRPFVKAGLFNYRSQEKGQGKRHRLTLPSAVVAELRRLCVHNDVTIFIALVSIVKIMLAKYTGRPEVAVVTDSAGRSHSAFKNVIGHFLNTILLRSKVPFEKNVWQFVQATKEQFLQATQHQDFPLELILRESKGEYLSLLNVVVLCHNLGYRLTPSESFAGCEMSPVNLPEKRKLTDLTFEFFDDDAATIELLVHYNDDLFRDEWVANFGRHFVNFLARVIALPEASIDRLSILSTDEEQMLLSYGETGRTDLTGDIVSAIEAMAKMNRHRIAVTCDDVFLTYGELWHGSSARALDLKQRYAVEAGDRVIICQSRSVQFLINVLAVLKLGAAFVPVDPEWPANRKQYIFSQTDCRVVLIDPDDSDWGHITSPQQRIDIDQRRSDEAFGQYGPELNFSQPAISPESAAYIMYTSGTTGKPKGVVISRHALFDYAITFSGYFQLSDTDSVIQQSSIAFDTSMEEIFPILTRGGRVIIAKEGGRDIPRLLEKIRQQRATILSTTPLVIHELNAYPDQIRELRVLISGGDRLSKKNVDKLVGEVEIYNTYGPTETAVCASFNPLESFEDVSFIGKPVSNKQIFIVTEHGDPAPLFTPGEICIAGNGNALGYLNAPAETSEAFTSLSLFDDDRHVYRTGDIGRWHTHGRIEFLGRKDSQVKISGYRVELEEVTASIEAIAEVVSCVVTKCMEETHAYLAAYIVPVQSQEEKVLKEIQITLPWYMVPASILFIEKMPTNTSGKVDVSALPVPTRQAGETDTDRPQNYIEQVIAGSMAEILKVDFIGRQSNFFELGANSIMASQLIAKVSGRLSVEISVKQFFENPSVEKIANVIGAKSTFGQNRITPMEEQQYYAASSLQTRLWMLNEMDRQHGAYNLAWTYRLGVVATSTVERALHDLVREHPAFRTTFEFIDGTLKQIIRPFQSGILDHAVRIKRLSSSSFYSMVKKMAGEDAAIKFDLVQGPLFRFTIARSENGDCSLIMVVHHIIIDGWSAEIILADLLSYIDVGDPAHKKSVRNHIDYKDYSAWQSKNLRGDAMQKGMKYWAAKIPVEIPVLNLPTTFSRPREFSGNGDTLCFHFSDDLSKALFAMAKKNKVTDFVVLLALVKVLLHRYSGQSRIMIGTPVSGRDNPELQRQVGYYINTVLIYSEIDPLRSFQHYMQVVSQTVQEALENQHYPIEEIIRNMDLPRDTSRSALFDVLVVFQNFRALRRSLQTPLVDASLEEIRTKTSITDLHFEFIETAEGLELKIRYNTDLYAAGEIERMFRHLQALASGIVENTGMEISRVDYLTHEEKQQLATAKVTEFDNRSFVALFAEVVEKHPDRAMVVDKDSVFTYAFLNARANSLATALNQTYGIGRGHVVGVMSNRSVDLIVSVLAVVKSGAAYLPLDERLPDEQIRHIVQDSGIRLILCDANTKNAIRRVDDTIGVFEVNRVPTSAQAEFNPPQDILAGDPVYIIYTSGSTGTPKGTVVTHGNVSNIALSWQKQYGLSGWSIRLLQIASVSFDVFFGDLCRALLNGGLLIISPLETSLDPPALEAFIHDHHVTIVESTPGILVPLAAVANERGRKLSPIALLILGSDSCYVNDFKKLCQACESSTRIVNSYGTTETTIDSSFLEGNTTTLPSSGIVPIGKPFDNIHYFILDKAQQLVPVGVIGELYIGGKGVSAGYLNNPELTHEKFVEGLPYGERLYKTGDLAKWLPDGSVSFIGRNDTQVKIRGYRVELSEIESVLLAHPLLDEAVVLAMADTTGAMSLAAFVIHHGDLEIAALHHWLEKKLPAAMVPSTIIPIEKLPLTKNNKIDKVSLFTRFAEFQPDRRVDATQQPKGITQAIIHSIWCDVLSTEAVGVSTSFFSLGGNSIKAVQVINQIKKTLGVQVSLIDFFSHATIKGLAEVVEGLPHHHSWNVVPVEEQAHYFLTPSQKGIWMAESKIQERSAYNISWAYHLRGELSVDRLQQAFTFMLARYEALRTRFSVARDGSIQQRVDELRTGDGVIEQGDVSHAANPMEAASDIASVEEYRPFNLSKAPLIRIKVLYLGPHEHVLIVTVHHIIADAWSMQILVRDFINAFNALDETSAIAFPTPQWQYKDYLRWCHAMTNAGILKSQRDYWRTQFKEDVPEFNFPYDHPKGVKTFNGSKFSTTWAMPWAQGIDKVFDQGQRTMFSFLVAVGSVLIHKYSNLDDFVIGIPVSGRDQVEWEEQIGLFVNTLPVRIKIESHTNFRQLWESILNKLVEAMANSSYPFELVLDDLPLQRHRAGSSLFDITFVLHDKFLAKEPDKPQGLTLAPLASKSYVSKFDLSFVFQVVPKGLSLDVEYSTDLFSMETIERLVTRLQRIMVRVMDQPSILIEDISLLDSTEITAQLQKSKGPDEQLPDATIQALFKAQAKEKPDVAAVVFEDRTFTYGWLDSITDALAWKLTEEYGVQCEDIIGVLLEPSEKVMIAMLGILKAGGTYLPIDPDFPAERKKFILHDSHPKVLIAGKAEDRLLHHACIDLSAFRTPEVQPDFPVAGKPHNSMYCLYTSGTTGHPKGVIVENLGVVNLVKWIADMTGATYPQSFLLTASVTFDASVQSLFTPLLTGNKLVITPIQIKKNPQQYIQYIVNNSINVLDITPSYLNAVLDFVQDRGIQDHLKTILIGGEPLWEELVMKFDRAVPGVRLMNVYGITEATVDTTFIMAENRFPDSIGTPIPNNAIYVIDKDHRPQADGVVGELAIAGVGVGRGYLNNPEATAAKFIPNPFGEGKVYLSGDLAKWKDGQILYVGRMDDQVKVRGYRIELGEVEKALAGYEGIKQSVVLPVTRSGATELVACFVSLQRLDIPSVKNFLLKLLPAYMVPARVIQVQHFELTSSGKIDRARLLASLEHLAADDFFKSAENATEEKLRALWKNLFPGEKIGVDDNFFELGGHSLKAMRLMATLASEFDVEISLKDIFLHPSVRQLAHLISKTRTGTLNPIVAIEEQDHFVLSNGQKRQWLLEQQQSGDRSYLMAAAFEVKGALDTASFNRAYQSLIAEHESLRTNFKFIDAQPRQVIRPAAYSTAFEIDAINLERVHDQTSLIHERIEQLTQAPFDLENDFLLRAAIFKKDPHTAIFAICLHHIISDAWSVEIMQNEIINRYNLLVRKQAVPLRNLDVQYRDYAAWQYRNLKQGFHDRSEKFWHRHLMADGVPIPTRIPGDHFDDSVAQGINQFLTFELGAMVTSRLRALAQTQETSFFVVLLSFVKVLAHKFSSQQNVIIGLPLANRHHAALQDQLGFYVNTIPLRTPINPEAGFADVVHCVKATFLDAAEHGEYPFDCMLQKMNEEAGFVKRLVHIMMVFNEEKNDESLATGPLKFTSVKLPSPAAKMDLIFNFSLSHDTVSAVLEYNGALYKPETIEYYVHVLQQMMHDASLDSETSIAKMISLESPMDTDGNLVKNVAVNF